VEEGSIISLISVAFAEKKKKEGQGPKGDDIHDVCGKGKGKREKPALCLLCQRGTFLREKVGSRALPPVK